MSAMHFSPMLVEASGRHVEFVGEVGGRDKDKFLMAGDYLKVYRRILEQSAAA